MVERGRIDAMPPRDVARAIAVVVPESEADLPNSVADIVLLGRSPHLGMWQRQGKHDIEIAADSLRRVGAEHLAGRDFGQLSGGERRRVLIARALAQQATHLLMDEPTNHLDIRFQHEVTSLVRRLGVTTVVVLHDLNLAARYCDSLVLLSGGAVVAAGDVRSVLRPEILETVYGVGIQPVVTDDGHVQFLFRAPGDRASGNEMSGTRGNVDSTI